MQTMNDSSKLRDAPDGCSACDGTVVPGDALRLPATRRSLAMPKVRQPDSLPGQLPLFSDIPSTEDRE